MYVDSGATLDIFCTGYSTCRFMDLFLHGDTTMRCDYEEYSLCYSNAIYVYEGVHFISNGASGSNHYLYNSTANLTCSNGNQYYCYNGDVILRGTNEMLL